ncbi:MAG: hypothetical protein IKZ86_11370, partial [Spirochaetaceae bacterium]|nr:hypothetical protein [Spirochaetaceae bacterium]
MSVRIKALIISLIQFGVFSVAGFVLAVSLFHAALLAFPVIAFMWTFWGFNILVLVTGVPVKMRYKLSFAFLNLLVIALLLAFCIIFADSYQTEKKALYQTITIIVSVFAISAYTFTLIRFIKGYWQPAKEGVLKLLKK